MSNNLKILGYNDIAKYNEKIIDTLSSYTETYVEANRNVTYKIVKDNYFLINNDWNISFIGNIEQFKAQYATFQYAWKNIKLSFCSDYNLGLEIKYILYNKLFNNEWSLKTVVSLHLASLKKVFEFMREKYPLSDSLLQLNIETGSFQWVDWLESKDIKTTIEKHYDIYDKKYKEKTTIANFLSSIYKWLENETDTRDEWEKDIWDVVNLKKYGIYYIESNCARYINFTKIKNLNIRESIKRYFKQRFLSKNKFTLEGALTYLKYLPNFINYVLELEPSWNDLKQLERKHIEKYIEWLNVYTEQNFTRKESNPESYQRLALTMIKKFLLEIQMREYEIAPYKDIRKLLFLDDMPTLKNKHYDNIKYIPDIVLEQLFKYIECLSKDIQVIIWIMYKTGLRISDTLNLKQDCLIRINNKYWIETDVKKTYVIEHRIPIDDELASLIAILIDTSKKNSNMDNNPKNLIFVRCTGKRKGKTYLRASISRALNKMALNHNIIDESGNKFHFNNHAFRHTYAIKLLNGGTDIFTVQELLAHASPEMTLHYAKLLDDTKRKAFDNAVKQGVFSFDIEGNLQDETNREIPENILDMLWTNHKLNAIDTPYGTCLQRSKGKCTFAKQPPCLTCDGGKPCKDLSVGIFEGDIKKYEIHITSTKALLEQVKIYNRKDMVLENEEILNCYNRIYSTISSGNIIYGRLDRLRKQGDVSE
ncbi:tyrosine-type recombinase/integrase [Clostridium pasteurianum]|uniref:Site-specific recombinase XerD n=1 Tax=Clostridium pasteurianum BC1 TaxID=86416 RepID=R4K608_CLOPA|nr:tyrosine-type recombinase/integrase [Clostridium pasteurianum]AGK97136.1 site-specific recombinase XerD [Clostridium pasteurianum BC1]